MLKNDPPSIDEDVARLRLRFYNTSLSMLEEYGLITHDRDENIVRKGPEFDAINQLSNLPDNHNGELPDEYL